MKRKIESPAPMLKSQERQAWEAALAARFVREYEANPAWDASQLSPLDRFQGQQTYHTIIPWLQEYGPRFIQEREILAESFGVECDPSVIILSNVPGVMACNAIFKKEKPPLVFYLTPESFDGFLEEHPDEKQRWHVTYLCAFSEQLEDAVLAKAKKKYKLAKTEQYWVHHEVSAMAPLFVRGCQHLWKWNGEKAELLEEAFYTWMS